MYASLDNTLDDNMDSAIMLQRGGDGYEVQRPRFSLVEGVCNNSYHLTWQQGAGYHLIGRWWIVGECYLGGDGTATLDIGNRKVLAGNPRLRDKIRRWVR